MPYPIPCSAEHPSRRFRLRLLATVGVCLGAWAAIGNAAAMTLTEALAAAYSNNPTLLAQRARLRQSDEGVNQALSGWRPTVQFTGTAGVSRFESNAPVASGQTGAGGSDTLTPRTLDLNVTQPVYSGG